MLKKYLFSDAEKASVEREIEIQQVCFSHPATCEQQKKYRTREIVYIWWAPAARKETRRETMAKLEPQPAI